MGRLAVGTRGETPAEGVGETGGLAAGAVAVPAWMVAGLGAVIVVAALVSVVARARRRRGGLR